MTAKEKAIELIKKFDPIVYPYLGSGFMTNTEDEDVILKNAKKCALITIEEIKESVSNNNDFKYWQDVKKEVESTFRILK